MRQKVCYYRYVQRIKSNGVLNYEENCISVYMYFGIGLFYTKYFRTNCQFISKIQ